MRLGGTDSEWHLVRDMDSSGTEGLWKGTWYGRKSPAVRNTSVERFCTRNEERNEEQRKKKDYETVGGNIGACAAGDAGSRGAADDYGGSNRGRTDAVRRGA